MAQCTATFELGTNGSDVLAANPGSATPWDSITHGGGDHITYDNAHKYDTLAAKIDSTVSSGASDNFMTWAAALGTLTDWYGRIYLYATANPTGGSYRLVRDGSNNFPLFINANGTVAMFDQGGQAIVTTATISLNQWVRIEFHWLNSATVGLVEVKLFNNPDSPTPTETKTSAANRNTSASTTALNIGLSNGGNPAGGPIWLDNIVMGALSYPGPAGGSGPGPANPLTDPQFPLAVLLDS